jgi:hypothetical protein
MAEVCIMKERLDLFDSKSPTSTVQIEALELCPTWSKPLFTCLWSVLTTVYAQMCLKPIPYCQMEYQENVARQLHSDSQTCITKGRGAKHDINEICYQTDSKYQHRTLF